MPMLISALSSSFRDKLAVGRRGSFFVGPDERDLEGGDPPDHLRRRSMEFERVQPKSTHRPSLLSAATTDGNMWSTATETGSLRGEPRNAEDGRMKDAALALLNTPQMRSMRLIGNSNPRYQW
jgi:hypothetical protein